MSKSSNKKKLKQLANWISEFRAGRGAKRIKNKYGKYIKIKSDVQNKNGQQSTKYGKS